MSEPKDIPPDDELLEFLGGGDDLAEDIEDEGFIEYLAENDIEAEGEEPPAEEGGKQ
jgi:hypothetical protein